MKNKNLVLVAGVVLTLFSSLVHAANRTHAEGLPPYVCEKLLTGAKAGLPYDGPALNIAKALVNTRYDVKTIGLQEILEKPNSTSGMVLMPNHTGPIDPVLMIAAAGQATAVRPVMTEGMLTGPIKYLLHPIFSGVNGFILPDPATGGKTGSALAEAVLLEVMHSLQQGDNVLIYPSGNIQRSKNELLGNKAAVEMILEKDRGARFVLVRQRGLWGSSWTHGAADAPDKPLATGQIIARGLKTAIKTLLANGLIFAPKRPVTLEFFEPEDFPRSGTRAEINAYLENFYNHPAEKRTFVKRYFWQFGKAKIQVSEKEIDYVTPVRGHSEEISISEVTDADPVVVTGLIQIAKSIFNTKDITQDSSFLELGLDSLNRTTLALDIEAKFGVAVADDAEFDSVADLARLVTKLKSEGSSTSKKISASKGWLKNFLSPELATIPEGETLTEMIVKKALAEPNKVIAEDQLRGPITYKTLLVKALALSKQLEKLPGERLGILMPAAGASPVFYLASHLAGKVPAYLNFTSKPEDVLKCIETAEVEKILTARAVVEKLAREYDMSKYMHRFVYVEDLVPKILMGMPKALMQVRLFPGTIAKYTRRTKDAVVLFTSGSSGTPKAVPLTHANILANIKDLVPIFGVKESDRLLLYLPPFHSFGHLVQAMSLTLGLPAIYYPKPQDAQVIANLIEAYKPTITAGPPLMVEGVARRGSPEQFDSLRLIFVGAEALKPEQISLINAKFRHADLLEGFGSTETAPVIAVNPPGRAKFGTVGQVLPSIEYRLVDPQTMQPVARGEDGLLLIRGPNVMQGYLQRDPKDGFVELDGKLFFNLKDLMREDGDGYLSFVGRISRRGKIGGEMVPFTPLEKVLAELAEPLRPNEVDGSQAAGPLVVVDQAEDNSPLTLVTTVDLDLASVQKYLRQKGISGVHMITEVLKVEVIPTLGTGKADVMSVKAMLKSSLKSVQ